MTHTKTTAFAAGLAIALAICSGLPVRTEHPLPAPAGVPRQGGRGGEGAKPAAVAPDPKRVIEGTDNDDTLAGGSGDDWLFGKKGTDYITGGGGRDRIDGGDGDDIIDGGADADIVDSGAGNDTVRGGDGDDTLDGSDEDDLLDGGAGVDDIDGGDGNDVLRGGAGNDVLAGGDDNDTLSGEAGNDRLSGEDGVDNLIGGAGDDLLFGGGGDDTLDGETGDDRLDGGDGSDVLRGGAGNDTLLGSAGNDILQGGDGQGTRLVGDGEDVLNGGSGSDWLLGSTGADVIVGGDGDDLIILRAGDVPRGEVETINGGAGIDRLVLNGFAGVAGLPGIGKGSDRPESDIVDPITKGVYRLVNVERTEFTQLITRADDGVDGPISVILVNPSPAAAAGRVIFYAPDGSVAKPTAAAGPSAPDDLTFTVPPLGSLRLDSVVRGPVVAQVFSAMPLGGVVVAANGGRGMVSYTETPLADSAIVPVLEDRGNGVASGVLVAAGVTPTNVKLTLHRIDGTELDGETFVGSKDLTLAPYAHRALFVRDLFPTLGDFQGAISVDSDISRAQEGGPITVTALTRGKGQLASFPASPLIAPVPGASWRLAGVTAGASSASSLVLTNASRSSRTQGTVRFFTEAGIPWVVGVNRQSPAATVAFDIGPQGSAVFALPAEGPELRGSVRIEATQGAVGATLRVSRAGGVSYTTPGPVFSSAMAAARRNRASGTTTRLALAAGDAAVVLKLTLRTAAGADAAGGNAEVRLAANGQAVRTIDELFPSAALDGFDGTVTIVSDGGSVSIAAVLIDGGETTLPVVALP